MVSLPYASPFVTHDWPQPLISFPFNYRESLFDCGLSVQNNSRVYGRNELTHVYQRAQRYGRGHRGKRGGRRKQRKIKRVSLPHPLYSTTRFEREKRTHHEPKNLVHIMDSGTKSDLKIGVWNSRSCRNKTSDIEETILDKRYDIFIITESWLAEEGDEPILEALSPNGYVAKSFPRTQRGGGGIAIVYRKELEEKMTFGQLACFGIKSFETCKLTIRNGQQIIRIITVYRPQDNFQNPFSLFIKEFNFLMTDLLKLTSPLFVVGDFNIHWNSPDNQMTKKLTDVLNNHDLEQHVRHPTNNVSKNTIDLVITSHSARISDLIVSDCDLSDHNIISFRTQFVKPSPKSITIKSRKLKDIKADMLNADIAESLSKANEITADSLDQTLRSILDNHAPITERKVKEHKCPWFNEDILKARKKKRQAERKWKKTCQISDKDRFNEARKLLNEIKLKAKQDFFMNRLQTSKMKDFQRTLDIITCKKSTPPLPKYTDNEFKVANDMMDYFRSKIENIQDSLKQIPSHKDFAEFAGKTHMTHFDPTSEDEIRSLILQSSTKSCELDSLPTNILKVCLESLTTPITDLINKSLGTGLFPSLFKNAVIRPLLKKQNLDPDDLKNYRPVSNLSFISKITEKVVLRRLMKHFHENNLEEKFQSAYREYHSTETATLRIANDLISSADRRNVMVLTLLDASAAFDCVDHGILLQRLEKTFGIKGMVLEWIRSYLSDRTQRVTVGEAYSEYSVLKCGVPQGSCLGPVLYTIYTMPIYEMIKRSDIGFHAYADDIQLYASVQRQELDADDNGSTALRQLTEKIELTVCRMKSWMDENRLKLNESKTECLVVGNKYTLKNFQKQLGSDFSLDINGSKILPSSSVRNLGVYFDCELNYKDHVNNLCKSIYFGMKKLNNCRKFMTVDAAKTLAVQLILSKMDYCNSLLYGANEDLLDKLQIAMNNTARIVLRKKKYDSASQMLRDLHWLPIRKRIQFKIASLCFAYFDGSLPLYLSEMLTLYQPSRTLRSSSDPRIFITPKTISRFGEKAWIHAGPKIWNALPMEIRYSLSKKSFKKKLKTYYFNCP